MPHVSRPGSRVTRSVRAQGAAPPLELTGTQARRRPEPQTETGGGADGGGRGGVAPPSGGGGGGGGAWGGRGEPDELGRNLNPFRR